MYDDVRLHVARSYTPLVHSPFYLISSFTLSNHLHLVHPLFLIPCTFISIAPFLHRPSAHYLLITCPYYFNLLSWTSCAISPTFVVHHILSFLILSSIVTLHIHRSIRISATSNLFSCAFFNAHVSAPHISDGLTTDVNTLPLVFAFISLLHNSTYTLFQFFHQL